MLAMQRASERHFIEIFIAAEHLLFEVLCNTCLTRAGNLLGICMSYPNKFDFSPHALPGAVLNIYRGISLNWVISSVW